MLDFPDRILKRSYLKEYTRKMVLLGEKLSGSLGIAVKVRVCGGNFVVEPQNYPTYTPNHGNSQRTNYRILEIFC